MDFPEKVTVLEQLDSGRASLDRLLVEVGVDRMTQPIEGGWSVKDIVAHIMAYDRWWAAQIQSTVHGTAPTAMEQYGSEDLPPGADPFDLERLNASLHDRYQSWSLDKVLLTAQEAFASLRQAIEDIPAVLLLKPSVLGLYKGECLKDMIPEQIIGHYQEHEPGLRSWIMQDEGLTAESDEPVES